jgi:hypothetical protein
LSKTNWLTALVAAAALTPVAAAAQDAAAVKCELHVWPSAGLNSAYHGWFHGGIANGAVTGRAGYPAMPPDLFKPDSQVALTTAVQPAAAIRRDDYRVVIHGDALSSRTIRTTSGRIGDSTAPCYAELIVEELFFQQDVFSGSYLRTMFRYREFGADAAPRRVFGTWVQTPLQLSPPKTSEAVGPAVAEMEAAYRTNFGLFGAALNKPAKDRK